MATTIEERILTLIESKAAAITTGASFEQTVKKVSRASGPDAPMDFDIATEVPGLQIRHLETRSEPHLRGATECQMDVKIVCIAESDATDEKISDLVGDVVKQVLANQRWNDGAINLARRTWIREVAVHETEEEESPVTGAVTFTVLFRIDAASPYSVKEI